MDAMSTLQLSQLRERAAQLLRKYRIPLLVFPIQIINTVNYPAHKLSSIL